MAEPDRANLLAAIAENHEAIAATMVKHRLQRLLDTHLSAARLHALVVLEMHGPQPAGDLARALGVSAASVTGLVDGLEKAGFAERRPDPDDGRSRVVHATATGVAAWRDAVLGPTEIDTGILDHLSDDELALIARAAAVLRRAVTDVTESA